MEPLDMIKDEQDKMRDKIHNLANDVNDLKLWNTAHPCSREKDWGTIQSFMANTDEYRKNLCSKIDKLFDKLEEVGTKFSNLPCSERKGWYSSMGRQVGFMWVVLGLILAAVVGTGFVNNLDKRQIMADIDKKTNCKEK